LICGDGGFMMNAQELETAVGLKLNLAILILQDNAYGMIRWKQAAGAGRRIARAHFEKLVSKREVARASMSASAGAQQVARSRQMQGNDKCKTTQNARPHKKIERVCFAIGTRRSLLAF
jgi:thiamine pyrophosphate-dependent acetolactate synthase large subunit-like protein